ncbi:type II toxin-antitoxin system Phd/YefM family antitoxin [Arthrobacter livingstonensis]|nr:type II toxin-antitoxin system Phd/YefM family antitoxin [Arthrobacter livingstonensis]
MATITVRELARNAKEVFDELEESGAPLVITRNGLPVAALVSIDQHEAEAYLIASAPELIENRKHAEAAILEGRTIPLAEALLEFGNEPAESEPEEITAGEPELVDATDGRQAVEPGWALEWTELAPLIGSSLVGEVEKEAVQFTEEVTKKTLQAVGAAQGAVAGEGGKWQAELQQLNERLFGLKFRDEILRVTQERLSAISGGVLTGVDIGSDRLVGRHQTDAAFKVVAVSVGKMNSTLIAHSAKQRDPLVAYQLLESGLQGGIASFA